MVSQSLMKTYVEVANLFDKIKGSDDPLTKNSIDGLIRDNGIIPDKLFQPTDICYNHTTKPLGNDDDDFERIPHVFEYLGRNKYKVLGTDYPYTGVVLRKRSVDGKTVIVGEWLNGRLIKWDKNKQLDIEELEEETAALAEEITDEIDALDLKGEDKALLVKTRVNQGIFRTRLLRRYPHCCLCNVTCDHLLIASHIKPWAYCEPEEKLDVNNGFLFCPNHDALFDKGFISFEDNGKILILKEMSKVDRTFMNVHEDMKVEVCEENRKYLKFHREHVFNR